MSTVAESMNKFIGLYGAAANAAAANSPIFPQTILTAAALESAYAKSSLSATHYNFFGIKASASWKGKTVTLRTAEQKKDGTVYYVNAPFRKYDNPQQCFADYVKFIQGPRYVAAGVTKATSPTEQFERIHAAGYATDVKYSTKLKTIFNSVKSWVITNPAKSAGAGIVVFFLQLL